MIQTLQQAETARRINKTWGVKIEFPAYGELDALTLWFGIQDFEFYNSNNQVANGEYKAGLVGDAVVREQVGVGQDSANFSIENVENYWHNIISDYEDVYEDVKVTIVEAIETEKGVFEGEIIFNGYAEDIEASDSEQVLAFNCVGDLSSDKFTTGGRILTLRYCGTKFNVNGLLSPEVDPCGWQTAQGGNALECDHTFDGANGCVAHNNDWRFWAVRGLTSSYLEVSTAPGGAGGGGGGGFDDDPIYPRDPYRGCFSGRTLVRMADGTRKRFDALTPGEWVRCFDVNDKNRIFKGRIKKIFRNPTTEIAIVHFVSGEILEVKPKHRFYVGNRKYVAIQDLENGMMTRFYDNRKKKWVFEQIDYIENATIAEEDYFNMEVEHYHNYFVSRIFREVDAAVSNLKEEQPIY